MARSKDSVISLNMFIIQADILAKSIGLIPYDDGKKRPIYEQIMKWYFMINMVNLNLVLILEMTYVFFAIKNRTHFVEATMSLSYIGFVVVGEIKILSVLRKKPLLTELMKELHRIYPMEREKQAMYRVREYVWRFNMVSLGFVVIHEILIWFYNLYTAVSYLIYERWLGWYEVPRALPYFMWLPWDWETHWSYYIMYASEDLAGHTCMSGQLANDLLLCIAVVQIIMHFEYLAKSLREYVPQGCYTKDLEFLAQSIKYHQTILNLVEMMNEVFGVSLFFNFMSSTFVMCFLGFQMTMGVQADILVMLFMFLFCSLVQILMICNYSQELIVKSEAIGHAVYEQNWINSDLRYRKMLVAIICRAQRPTILQATTFIDVSRGTVTDIVQISYKFFALIRTMYAE